MSDPGQERAARVADATPPRRRPTRAVLRWVGGSVATLLLLGGLLAGLVVVRLAAAPMSIDVLLPHALPPLVEMQTGDPLRITVRHATVQWLLFREAGAPFRVRATALSAQRLRAPTDRAQIAQLQTDLAPLPLLITQVRPIRVHIAGLRGTLGVDAAGQPKPLPPHRTLHERLHDEFGRRRAPAPVSGVPPWLTARTEMPPWGRRLRELRIDDAAIDLTGGQAWSVRVPQLLLARSRRGAAQAPASWSGNARLELAGAAPTLILTAEGGANGVWHVHVGPMTPSAWPELLPFGIVLPTNLQAVTVPLSLDAQLRMAEVPLPLAATLTIGAGSGQFGDLAIDGATLRASARRDGRQVAAEIQQAELRPHGLPPLHLHGTAQADTALHQPRIAVQGGFPPGPEPALDLARLAALWPPAIAHGARAWITTNMPSGTIHRLGFDVALAGPTFARLDVASVHAGLDVADAELHWLRPMPPLTAVAGHVQIDQPDQMHITVAQGRQDDGAGHAIALRSGAMTITGLDKPDQDAAIGIDLAGDLGAILHLLAHPRLHLLSRTSLDLSGAAGAAEMSVHLGLPLRGDVRADQIDVIADAHVAQAALAHAIAGQPLDDATLDLHATQQGMHLDGRGLVAHLPSALTLAMDFRDGPPTQTTMHATLDVQADRAHVLPAARQQGFGWLVDGQNDQAATIGVVYDAHRSGLSQVAVDADLTPLALRLPVGWSKPAGEVAHASGTLLLDHDHIAGVEALRIDAPGFVARADGSRLGDPGSDLAGVRIVTSRLEVGRTRMSGSVVLPADPTQPDVAHIDAPVIDLGPMLDQSSDTRRALDSIPGGSPPAAQAKSPRRPWSVDARIGRLLLGARSAFGGIRLAIGGRGAEVDRGSLVATKPAPLDLRLVPAGAGLHVTGGAADLGALLTGLDLGTSVRQGKASLDARTADRRFAGAIEGGVNVDDVQVAGVPAVARAAAVLSLGGLLGQAKTGDAVVVKTATVPFRYEHGAVQIHDARAHNPALGVTMHGRIDLHRSQADLRGTVVPGYLFNHLPGQLPVVGKLFSPETGGGLVAMTMSISGPLDDPAVSVNPLSMLAPGALRALFK